ncbi:hypothetical protein NUU61_004320 [Penicillium alfredii]|uniref:Uncharacterized protein n=1 Tax=Penicillium alfredii TaxID=1506179 RepID=A0A9W9FKX0_9EURO|nr:uncharacterized protein NUU61_004320 [Penicillium alfredii]KAJ5102098.1 hypothetical protein NUU61_004320 [Penicillium alfredii]
MKPATWLVILAPAAALADSQPALDRTADLAHISPAESIPALAPRDSLPIPEAAESNPVDETPGARGARQVLQARSEGTLGQTPWIGMAIGLTCTALAAVMLG